MKNEINYIETKTEKIPLCFNLNVMEEIQSAYGSISQWGEIVEDKESGEPKIKDLKVGLLSMINEGIDIENEGKEEKRQMMTSKELGRVISEIGFDGIVKIIKKITVNATKTDEEAKNE